MKKKMLNILRIALSTVCVFSIIFFFSKSTFSSLYPSGCAINLPCMGRSGTKEPTPEQMQSGKDVGTIAWSEVTGGPKHIRGPITAPSQDDPETIALRFLEEKKVLYGIKDPYQDLYKIKSDTCQETGYTTIHFGQIYKGVPVENRLVISVASNGVISSISGVYYPDIEVDVNPVVSAEEAKAIALPHELNCGSPFAKALEDMPKFLPFGPFPTIDEEFIKTIEPELLIWPAAKDYLLWHFRIRFWNFHIDAHEGVIRGASPTWYAIGGGGPSSGTLEEMDTTWPNIEVSSVSLDFGEIQIGQNSPIKEVIIANTGEVDLVITDISLSESAFALQEFSGSFPVSIAHEENLILQLYFSPTSSGLFEGTVVIASNDPYYPQFEIALQGRGLIPAIQQTTQNLFYYPLASYLFWPKDLDFYGFWPYYSFLYPGENNIKYFGKKSYFLFPYAPLIDFFNQPIWEQHYHNYLYNSSNLPYFE